MSKVCSSVMFFFGFGLSQVSWANNQSSICSYLDDNRYAYCSDDESLLGSENNLNKYFMKFDGYHAGNNERQMYRQGQVHWDGADNIVTLIAELKTSGAYPFTSGEIKTQGKYVLTQDHEKKEITHGAIEVTAQIPYDSGRWPAIWMMPDYDAAHVWPSGMEIDILEFMRPPFPVTGTIHYGLEGKNIATGASWNYNNNEDLPNAPTPATRINNDWHNYGLEWDVDPSQAKLTWYFDGQPFYQINLRHENGSYSAEMLNPRTGEKKPLICQPWTNRCPSQPSGGHISLAEAAYRSFRNGFASGYYLIINMAIGGNGVSPEPSTEPGIFPYTEMKVSQVHRYIISARDS